MNIFKTALATALFSVAFAAVPADAARVAVVQGNYYTGDLASTLRSKGNTVDEIMTYDATSLGSYDTVIEYGNTFVNQTALSTFVSAGGTLIWTPWAGLNYNVDTALQVFTNGGSPSFSASNKSVTIVAPTSALLNGVTFPSAGSTNVGRIDGITFAAGSTQIAQWSDGAAFVGTRALGSGTVVGINLQAITSDTAFGAINQPWASTLFDNAANVNGAVPEPATWAMMILGMGAVGYAMRRRIKLSEVNFTSHMRTIAGA